MTRPDFPAPPHSYVLYTDGTVHKTSSMNELYDCRGNEVIGREQFGNVIISTVFLYTDVNLGTGSEPSLFETSILEMSDKGVAQDVNIVQRYSTHEAAKRGHDKTVQEYNEKTREGNETTTE